MFSQDGALYRFGTWVVNIFVLNSLWVLFSLPIITIGASTTATFYIAQQWVRGKEPLLWSRFWKSFRENFIQATLIWLIVGVIGGIVCINVRGLFYSGPSGTFLYLLQLVILVELFLTTVYALSLLARFRMTVLGCLRSAFFMTHRHFSTSVSILVLSFILGWLSYYWPVLILLVTALFTSGVSFLQINVFARYN